MRVEIGLKNSPSANHPTLLPRSPAQQLTSTRRHWLPRVEPANGSKRAKANVSAAQRCPGEPGWHPVDIKHVANVQTIREKNFLWIGRRQSLYYAKVDDFRS